MKLINKEIFIIDQIIKFDKILSFIFLNIKMKLFNKPVGITSNEFIYNLKKDGILNSKACYCGRLDPMARGEMLILEGEECKSMPKYLKKDKIYEFEIIFGFSTDTDDYLGIIDDSKLDSLIVDEIIDNKLQNKINEVKNIASQKFHVYSSYVLRKNDLRKPLWEWHKLGQLEDSEIPIKSVKIKDFKILDRKYYSKKYLINIFLDNIGKISDKHNFRQNVIKNQWDLILNSSKKFIVQSIKCQIHVSSGFYVRQLIYDLKKNLKFPLMVYDINRIRI